MKRKYDLLNISTPNKQPQHDGDLQDRVCRLLRSLDKMVSIVSLTVLDQAVSPAIRKLRKTSFLVC